MSEALAKTTDQRIAEISRENIRIGQMELDQRGENQGGRRAA